MAMKIQGVAKMAIPIYDELRAASWCAALRRYCYFWNATPADTGKKNITTRPSTTWLSMFWRHGDYVLIDPHSTTGGILFYLWVVPMRY